MFSGILACPFALPIVSANRPCNISGLLTATPCMPITVPQSGRSTRVPVDVIIVTFNEEINLPFTLRSVSDWANQIFVVDSGSTDRTREIARGFGAEVIEHTWEGYARQKNWALRNLPLNAPWTLIVDADEAVSERLRDEISLLCQKPPADVAEAGFFVNRALIFMGKRIRHCGYNPSWNLRLFKHGRAHYEDRPVHEHMILDGKAGYLRHLLLHEDRRGLEYYIAKHNRYSTLEAETLLHQHTLEQHPSVQPRLLGNAVERRRWFRNNLYPHLPAKWLWRFLWMYVIRTGFLDGMNGLRFCLIISTHELFTALKIRELQGRPGQSLGAAMVEGAATAARQYQTPDLLRLPSCARRLIVLPDVPGNRSGYQKAVQADLDRLRPTASDVVVVFTDELTSPPGFLRISRLQGRFLRRVFNSIRLRPSAELTTSALAIALSRQTEPFDQIFCGDSVLYRALRTMFPRAHMLCRFHNLFSISGFRIRMRSQRVNWRFAHVVAAFTRLESRILRDRNTSPIFITVEELHHASVAFPGLRGHVWPIYSEPITPSPSIRPPTTRRLVFMGSLASHTRSGVDHLVSSVFPRLRLLMPEVELYLYGSGTEAFESPGSGIHGCGRYPGDDVPFQGDALYVVPDAVGGGIKVKVRDLLIARVPFITTHFGAEGYDLGGSPHVLIADIDDWPSMIATYFSRIGR